MEIFPLADKHDDVMIWKPFAYHWPFMRGIHRPPVDSPHEVSVMRGSDALLDGGINDGATE